MHGHVHKDDHGVKVEFASDMRQFITIGGKRFHLRQFHFITPANIGSTENKRRWNSTWFTRMSMMAPWQ